MKKILIAVIALGAAHPAFAADEDSKVYGEIGVGAGFGKTDLQFQNPTGVRFTSNTTTGSYINLTNKDDSDTSFVGYAALGYNVTPNINVHASHQYLGKTQAAGGAASAVVGSPAAVLAALGDAHAAAWRRVLHAARTASWQPI